MVRSWPTTVAPTHTRRRSNERRKPSPAWGYHKKHGAKLFAGRQAPAGLRRRSAPGQHPMDKGGEAEAEEPVKPEKEGRRQEARRYLTRFARNAAREERGRGRCLAAVGCGPSIITSRNDALAQEPTARAFLRAYVAGETAGNGAASYR
jgi:hypothetical protein